MVTECSAIWAIIFSLYASIGRTAGSTEGLEDVGRVRGRGVLEPDWGEGRGVFKAAAEGGELEEDGTPGGTLKGNDDEKSLDV
mmetsp:Transcript_9989/g.9712  ORF Transcript_9989/g.9712 Transcript_9989/m.9712 type:complete len:83 (-) Transcript_9989:566-814(-)|eukprot:CAMPEP_0119053808 /NCGR_PEP_ID=MMETSP1177-20130426/74663_1 /TAXON_ID=2985 /ORGANISM="Ochromonas sp, Strain CCMP1899" /LENGTH=82 /DNA_ID=CAMNT_0007033861 /DNA_START=4325 /DNA_END=4573 /DNA_ORIENTATION=+